jgi:hypothetical protein
VAGFTLDAGVASSESEVHRRPRLEPLDIAPLSTPALAIAMATSAISRSWMSGRVADIALGRLILNVQDELAQPMVFGEQLLKSWFRGSRFVPLFRIPRRGHIFIPLPSRLLSLIPNLGRIDLITQSVRKIRANFVELFPALSTQLFELLEFVLGEVEVIVVVHNLTSSTFGVMLSAASNGKRYHNKPAQMNTTAALNRSAGHFTRTGFCGSRMSQAH